MDPYLVCSWGFDRFFYKFKELSTHNTTRTSFAFDTLFFTPSSNLRSATYCVLRKRLRVKRCNSVPQDTATVCLQTLQQCASRHCLQTPRDSLTQDQYEYEYISVSEGVSESVSVPRKRSSQCVWLVRVWLVSRRKRASPHRHAYPQLNT
jgi:hypothetical protein